MAEKLSNFESQDLDYEDPCVDSDQSEDDDPSNEPDSEPEESSDDTRSKIYTYIPKHNSQPSSGTIAICHYHSSQTLTFLLNIT